MSGQNKNREKEEKLFRALSGVDEELLLRSEQNDGWEKQKANGKIHRFPLRYVSRIAAACLCFVVAGVLYVTMSSTKMADSTGSDMAAAEAVDTAAGNECAAPQQVYEAAQAEDTADMPEGAAEVTTDMDGAVTENQQQAAQSSDSTMADKQGSQTSVSGNEASGTEDNTEAVKEQEEETLPEKEVSPSLEKMKAKGQQ